MTSYKKEAAQLRTEKELMRQANEVLETKLKKIEDDKKKRWSAIVFCGNCLEVNSISVPPDVLIATTGDCVTCRVRGKLQLVRKVNNCH